MNQAKNPEWQAGWVDIAVEQCEQLFKPFCVPIQSGSRFNQGLGPAEGWSPFPVSMLLPGVCCL